MGPEDCVVTSRMNFWKSIRRLWCHHRHVIVTPRTQEMPSHTVCQACGWRMPVPATRPVGTRTWDSSRDEQRFEREKRRRLVAEQRKQVAASQLAAPAPKLSRARREDDDNVVQIAQRKAR